MSVATCFSPSRMFGPVQPIGRRGFLGGTAALAGVGGVGLAAAGPALGPIPGPATGAGPGAPAPPTPVQYAEADRAAWNEFKRRFVKEDGRVVDTGNAGVSHSEGQGWGMMMAACLDDGDTFLRMADWTRRTLRCRAGDLLHAWRYRPGQADPVSDTNNATDGDLFVAAALARAGVRWDRPELRQEAAAIAADIVRLLVRPCGPWTVLLPGAAGFQRSGGVVVNPSYYAFALFDDLAAVCPSPVWDRLGTDGLAIIQQCRTGPAMLPPDWVLVDRHDGRLSPAPGWPARFSYDAIRIPLHLAWGRRDAPAVLDSFRRYWTAAPQRPAWVDLKTGALSPYPAGAGARAVAALVGSSDNFRVTEASPSVMEAEDYYGAGLIVLSRLASSEGRMLA